MSRPRGPISRFLVIALIVAAALAARTLGGRGHAAGPGGFQPLTPAVGGHGHAGGPRRFQPLTPWQRPTLELPAARRLDYGQLAEAGLRQGARWRDGSWYCEYLGCDDGPYPLVSLWGEVPMFEAVDALDIGFPSPAHRASVEHFARANERYWDPALGGYAPYPGDREADVQAFFDDNGWEGLAFYNAYQATGERRWLYDAQRALRFIAARGWDQNGGGMWWNTSHPYHSGPALASDSLLGILLYGADAEAWQLEDVKSYVDWANANDNHDERQLYLEKPNEPESVNDYVQAPLVYTQYLLCRDGQGNSYCVQAGRVAATMAEEDVDAYGYKYNYGAEYDAIFMQWMMAYGQQTDQRYWSTLAQVNAAAAAEHAGDGQGLWLSSWWGGTIADPETHPDMFRTMAATTSLFAWTGVYAKVSQ